MHTVRCLSCRGYVCHYIDINCYRVHTYETVNPYWFCHLIKWLQCILLNIYYIDVSNNSRNSTVRYSCPCACHERYMEEEVEVHVFLTSAPDKVTSQFHDSTALLPGKEPRYASNKTDRLQSPFRRSGEGKHPLPVFENRTTIPRFSSP